METIDLTLTSDSYSDPSIPVSAFDEPEQYSATPNFRVKTSSSSFSPFSEPLINVSRSLIDVYTASDADPVSILLKHLNEINYIIPSLYQAMFEGSISIITVFTGILSNSALFRTTKLLTFRAISSMAINNEDICRYVLDNIDFFLQMAPDNHFLIDLLDLFRVVSHYATVEEARKMIHMFHLELNLIHFGGDASLMESSRSGVLAVYSEIAKFGDIFPVELVHDILIKINFMVNGSVLKEISYPSMICIFEFLKQPDTDAYKYIESKTNILVPRLSLALESSVAQKEDDLQMIALKLLYSVFNEFNSNNTHSMYFCLLSSLNLIKFNGENKNMVYLAQILIDIIIAQK